MLGDHLLHLPYQRGADRGCSETPRRTPQRGHRLTPRQHESSCGWGHIRESAEARRAAVPQKPQNIKPLHLLGNLRAVRIGRLDLLAALLNLVMTAWTGSSVNRVGPSSQVAVNHPRARHMLPPVGRRGPCIPIAGPPAIPPPRQGGCCEGRVLGYGASSASTVRRSVR